jgi:hypothetical protein
MRDESSTPPAAVGDGPRMDTLIDGHCRGAPVARRTVRGPLPLIDAGEGIGPEATESRSGVAVATSRGRDAGIGPKSKPGDHQCN